LNIRKRFKHTFPAVAESTPEMSPLPFLHLMQTLKDLPRTGWLRTIETPELVASYSFGLALLGGFAPVSSCTASAFDYC
jgi:5'-deoxynucleotidase YfbR-like HD superfamily hydrolase